MLSHFQELALRDQLLAKQLKNDIALATACWKKNIVSTQNFCVTSSEPRVAWMPGVLDDGIEEYVDLHKRRKEVGVAIGACAGGNIVPQIVCVVGRWMP